MSGHLSLSYEDYAHLFLSFRLCKLLGDSISRNIERLSYARRIHSRKLINTTPTVNNPSGYIVANGDDLLVSSTRIRSTAVRVSITT